MYNARFLLYYALVLIKDFEEVKLHLQHPYMVALEIF